MTARKVDPEKKIAEVLDCALRLFVQKGYYNVSIPTIVKESGVSTGSIYSYFKNKEDLAEKIYFQLQARFNQELAARLADSTTSYEKLKVFMALVFEMTEQEPIIMEYMLFLRHTEFLSNSLPICHSAPFQTVRNILKEGMASGEVKTQDVFVAGISFTGVVLRAAELKLLGIFKYSLLESLEDFMNNAWNAVKNEAAGPLNPAQLPT